jgi:hypothetical protein
MQLSVQVKINPPPASRLPPESLDEAINAELYNFEKWFMDSQRAKGNQNPSPLIGVEGGILKTFVLYLATKEGFVEES